MPTADARFDAYIAKAPEYSRPILAELRAIVQDACPEAEETTKWSMPTFVYAGAIMCGLAAFKEHTRLHFWQHTLIAEQSSDADRAVLDKLQDLSSTKDIPSKAAIARLIKRAMKLNESGVKMQRAPSKNKKEISMPPALAAALEKDKRARAQWSAFSPSKQKEYMEWIGDAKSDDTRDRRLAQALEWIAEGKGRNWKYEKR
jgi:uncharacterized protein YdeI (YjbR/CyaY-like superfamily)